MNKIIGTCGNCGGKVTMPTHMVDASASCENCGAEPEEKFGRVIPMKEGNRAKTLWDGKQLLTEDII